MKKKKTLMSFLEGEASNKKKPVDTSKFNIPFDMILKEIELYKEDFKLSQHYNVRLTDDNYDKLKYLKLTDVSMMHLVNFIVKVVVESEDFDKFINKKT